MVSVKEEEFILSNAYVPEHIISLMSLISKGEPFLIDSYVIIVKDNLTIFIGYPLDKNFSLKRYEPILNEILKRFKPDFIRFIGPEIPSFLLESSIERQSDQYFLLDIDRTKIKNSLIRMVQKVSSQLSFEITNSYTKEHKELVSEFLKRENLIFQVKELYHCMPYYVTHSKTAYILNARDKKGKLTAFYIVEVGAKRFNTYLLGVYSKRYYLPHASDYLFYKMIELTSEQGKSEIHLGLGVNEGIRRFKEKWGGIPFLRYEYCESSCKKRSNTSLLRELERRL